MLDPYDIIFQYLLQTCCDGFKGFFFLILNTNQSTKKLSGYSSKQTVLRGYMTELIGIFFFQCLASKINLESI